jgi:hypothetical protein
MKLSRLATLAAVSAIALAVPASANHSWNNYHWATTNGTLDVKVNAAITSAWTGYVDEAIVDWEKSDDLELGNRNNLAVSRKRCSPVPREILVCNDAYGQRGWLGIASIWLDGNGHISQGTTKLNDTYFAAGRYNTPAWRRMVTCQEIGHDFGLAHQNEIFTNTNVGSCMDYTNDPSGTAGTNGTLSNEHPNSHDYAQLASIYGHSNDGYNSANASASTNFGIREVGKAPPAPPPTTPAGDSPAEWGRAIHNDGLGRPDVFVKELGNGHKVITHVFWALETKRADIHEDH